MSSGSRYIRKHLGINFTQFLSLTRCEEAARLLASTDKTADPQETSRILNRYLDAY